MIKKVVSKMCNKELILTDKSGMIKSRRNYAKKDISLSPRMEKKY